MSVRIIHGDCRSVLREMPAGSVNCIVTSPPYYGLRDYGVDGQIGLEQTPEAYIAELVAVFREARRVLRDDGTLWLNIGDSYASPPAGNKTPSGISQNTAKRLTTELQAFNTQRKWWGAAKPKDLLMIPARVALALQADGWYLRSEIIWHKPNPMPESIRDRPTSAHEKVYMLAKQTRYFYDHEAVKEPCISTSPAGNRVSATKGRLGGGGGWDTNPRPERSIPEGGRNLRNVWTITPKPFKGAHFAVFPPALVEPCIKAGCPEDGTVLDPFGGAGTTGLVASRLDRNAILIELNEAYASMARDRIAREAGMFAAVL